MRYMMKTVIYKLHVYTKKICRYDISGFVEELPRLSKNRAAHACAALPDTGVRPD